MVAYDSECCDHGEFEERESEPYDDSKPRWMFSLRNREPQKSGGKSKPAWTSAIKANSPSLRTYSEGGSLRTNRMRPRSKSTNRMSQSRSKSPGLFGSTYASRAKQREAIGTPLVRSRANSVCSTPPDSSRSRTRSLSPRRFRRQSASPARVPPNKGQRARRDFPKPPRKKENVPIPIKKVSEPKTPIPVNMTKQPSRPNYGVRPFNDRYQFEPLGDTLGRTNITNNSTRSYMENSSDQYHTKTWESYNSYFKDASSSNNNNDSSGMSFTQNTQNASNRTSAEESKNKYSSQNTSSSTYTKSLSSTVNNSSRRDSKINANIFPSTRGSESSNRSYNDGRQQDGTTSSYSANYEYSYENSNGDVKSSERRYENNNGDVRTSERKSSKTRGPNPLWLDDADTAHQPPEVAAGHNQMRRSSSASSRKSVSVTYIN